MRSRALLSRTGGSLSSAVSARYSPLTPRYSSFQPFPLHPSLPPSEPSSTASNPERQRFLLNAAVWIFVIVAILILILPIRLPRPIRLAVAGTDLIAAAVIWLLARQRFPRRSQRVERLKD